MYLIRTGYVISLNRNQLLKTDSPHLSSLKRMTSADVTEQGEIITVLVQSGKTKKQTVKMYDYAKDMSKVIRIFVFKSNIFLGCWKLCFGHKKHERN